MKNRENIMTTDRLTSVTVNPAGTTKVTLRELSSHGYSRKTFMRDLKKVVAKRSTK